MKTKLYDSHCALGAKIVDFAGWEMPVQYEGIIPEHMAVRDSVGIFDVSHMGRVIIRGKDAEKAIDYLSTNRIDNKKNGSATYTVWCTEDGGAVDDLIVYKESPQELFVVVNASNREKDLNHLLTHTKKFDVSIEPRYDDGILAVQGPKAKLLLTEIFPEIADVSPMTFTRIQYKGESIIVSGTGYTGSGGYELMASMEATVSLWNELLKQGQKYGIKPIGLGARDTLRLEMGYALYGHELSDTIMPNETVSSWTIRMKDRDFIGKQAMEKLNQSEHKRRPYGIKLSDKGIAREGYEVYKDDKKIGYVTSGTMSPCLNQAIALILVDQKLEEGENIEVQVRQRKCRAEVVKTPFVKI